MANYKEELINTSKGSVHSTFVDNQQDKTLVLLHGNSSSSNFWKPLMESSLRNSFNLLAFDLPGHGNSPVPNHPQESYSLPAYAEVLVEIVSAFSLKSYALFGHSLGGHVVLEALDQLPACEAAFIMGSPPFTLPPRLELAFHMSPQFVNFMQSGADRALMEATFKSMLSQEKEPLTKLLIEDYFKTDPQARALLTQNIYQGKFINELEVMKSSPVPVYILIAEGDQMVNPAYFDQLLSGMETILIPGTGHYAPLEAPDAFARIILDKSSRQVI